MSRKEHMQFIFEALNMGLFNRFPSFTVTHRVPDFGDYAIPPGSASGSVVIDGIDYVVTVKPAEAGDPSVGVIYPLPADQPSTDEEDEEPRKHPPRTFEIDHRDKPGLHDLYVGYAREEIRIIKTCCDDLVSLSRWPASIIASNLWEMVRNNVATDAAWFEAAALEFAEFETPKSPDLQLDLLTALPPGTYSGYLAHEDGRFRFVVDRDQKVEAKS